MHDVPTNVNTMHDVPTNVNTMHGRQRWQWVAEGGATSSHQPHTVRQRAVSPSARGMLSTASSSCCCSWTVQLVACKVTNQPRRHWLGLAGANERKKEKQEQFNPNHSPPTTPTNSHETQHPPTTNHQPPTTYHRPPTTNNQSVKFTAVLKFAAAATKRCTRPHMDPAEVKLLLATFTYWHSTSQPTAAFSVLPAV
jgi:hypothetical protein